MNATMLKTSPCRMSCTASASASAKLVSAKPFLAPTKRAEFLQVSRCSKGFRLSVSANADWPTSYSHIYEDITENLRPLLFLPEADPEKKVNTLMSTELFTTTEDEVLSTVIPMFDKVTGLPVLSSSGKCVGIISMKDLAKRDVMKSVESTTVGQIMTTPPITISESARVADAAAVMLKHKIHRIPVVNTEGAVIGMITRKDIFTALGQEA